MKSPKLGPPPKGPINPLLKYSLLGSAAKLRESAQQQKPLLGSVCLTGEATVWYASYNTGKTLLCLSQIVDAVRTGAVDPSKVFYANADDSKQGLADKEELFDDLGIHMLAPGLEGFETDRLITAMQEMIASDGCHGFVIVIDTLKRFVDVMEKSKIRVFTGLVRRFVMAGGTFLALAHTNKRPGKDGKPIPEGTADVLSDFDCAYLLQGLDDELTGERIVQFECVKSRGPAVRRAAYAYDASEMLTYVDRLCSIREVDYDADRAPLPKGLRFKAHDLE